MKRKLMMCLCAMFFLGISPLTFAESDNVTKQIQLLNSQIQVQFLTSENNFKKDL